MLEETASVIATEGNRARITLVRSEACGACSAKHICHPTSSKTMEMEVLNSAGAQAGDKVIISLPPEELLKASFSVYLMPAVAAVAGAAIGWSRSGTDTGAIIGCAIGLALASAWLFTLGRKRRAPAPFISRILESGRTTG